MEMSSYIEDTRKNLDDINTPEFVGLIEYAAKLILDSISAGGKILVCGNGGRVRS